MAKDKYEISLWDDVFVAASGNIPSHYEEEKIATIGSDSMTTQCRAIEPKLICNINGKVTFTFKMYYRYHDELTGEDYDNPFLKLLVNERKVKVKWLDQWYDLIIKNIQESSNGKTVVYTCEDANINELAKTGFNLIFDDDLSYNNVEGGNQGTVDELINRVVSGTDWVFDSDNSDTIPQYTEEAVYEASVPSNRNDPLLVKDMETDAAVNIAQGETFLVYYPQLSDIVNEGTSRTVSLNKLYLAYDPTQQYNRLAKTEMLVNADCCALGASGTASCSLIINGSTATFSTSYGSFGTININNVSSRYRANRLVQSQLMQLEPTTGKNCYVYRTSTPTTDPSVYKYTETEFKDATYATNLIANGSNFLSINGWNYPSGHALTIKLDSVPDTSTPGAAKAYLAMPSAGTASDSLYFYNNALNANSIYFKNGCKVGEKYVFRIKVKTSNFDNYINATDINLYPEICEYSSDKQPITNFTSYFTGATSPTYISGQGWVEFNLTCIKSFTASEILSKSIGLFIVQPVDTPARMIEAVEFFKYIEGENGQRINPGDLDVTGIAKTVYTYYYINNKKPVYLYSDTTDWNSPEYDGRTLNPVYVNNYSKVRSISVKQSNRFNILQTIAETFECWIKFNVPHDPDTGKLTYINGVPTKKIVVKHEIGEERSIGFVYGIDLQQIQRTIESNSIVTKTIVLENNNEFGENGTCRISRSSFNYPQTDYIFNFDYYINHNLMNGDELMTDLYYNNGDETTARGFYKNLHDWNIEYAELARKYSDYSIALTKNEGLQTVYKTCCDTARAEVKQHKRDVCDLLGTSAYSNNSTQTKIRDIMNNPSSETYTILNEHLVIIESQQQLYTTYSNLLSKVNQSIADYKNDIESIESNMTTLEAKITAKTQLFERKYARFISEGSWTDSKYYDDNLYYLDANSIAYTSSRPKVSYNISVIRLTSLDEFKIKDFKLGDVTYIQDTEFFGYTYIDNVKTPYHEKVIITEVTYNFDEPNKDTFKVQNYRTQFEDLFQRIAAQTQSLQYSAGAYNKVSDIIKTDSTIKKDILKASFDANGEVLDRTSVNNMVITDDNGITVTNIQNASEAVRVTSGGLFITTDGGDSWKNAIRGDGIGTQYLTSGAIDTKRIQIFGDEGTDENAVAFKWDAQGLNAYDKTSYYVAHSTEYAYDPLRFVRLNGTGVTIQEATGVLTDTNRMTYEKLKLGQIGTTGDGENERNVYGLKINSYVDGAVETAFAATDTGLFVKGNISATSLVIGPQETPILSVIDGEVNTAVTSVVGGIPIVNKVPNIYYGENTFENPREVNGITYNVKTDGSIEVSGIATDSSTYYLTGTSTDNVVPPIILDKTKQYFLSGCPSGGSDLTYRLNIRCFTDQQTPAATGGTVYKDYGGGVLIPAGYSYAIIYIYTYNGVNLSNAIVYKPQLTIGSTGQEWQSPRQGTDAMYSKITQTAEHVESEVRAGLPVINLVPSIYSTEIEHPSEDGKYTVNNLTFTVKSNGQVQVYGTASAATAYYLCGPYTNSAVSVMYLDPDKTYYVSGSPTGSSNPGYRMVARCYDSENAPSEGASVTRHDKGIYAAGDSISGYRYLVLMLYIDSGTAISSSSPVTFSPQVEVGTSRTLWNSPRVGAYSKITQTAYGISMAVAKDNVIASINMSAEQSGGSAIKINADKIDITGAVTFSSLNSSLQTAVNNANNAISSQIPIYYRSTSSTAPSAPTGQVTESSGNVDDTWTTVMPRPKKVDNNSYYYYYTCQQYNKNGTYSWSAVRPISNLNYTSRWCSANDQTYIDGGSIYANSVTANAIAAGAVTAAKISVDDLSALNATIGGWEISSTQLVKRTAATGGYRAGMNAPSNAAGSTRAFFICDETGQSNSYPFSVYYDGSIYSSKGTIGGWNIGPHLLSKVSTASMTGASGEYYYRAIVQSPSTPSSGNIAFAVQHATTSDSSSWSHDFYVTYGGRLYAKNATITGNITATSGAIGDCTISGNTLIIPNGKITANQINGTGLEITGSGKFGEFTIGTDDNGNPSINTSNGVTKLSDKALYTQVVMARVPSGQTGVAQIVGPIVQSTSNLQVYGSFTVGTVSSQTSKTPRWVTLPATMATVTALRSALEGLTVLVGY